MLLYGTGSTLAIIGFVLWPDLPTTQSLNYAFKTHPTVSIQCGCHFSMQLAVDVRIPEIFGGVEGEGIFIGTYNGLK